MGVSPGLLSMEREWMSILMELWSPQVIQTLSWHLDHGLPLGILEARLWRVWDRADPGSQSPTTGSSEGSTVHSLYLCEVTASTDFPQPPHADAANDGLWMPQSCHHDGSPRCLGLDSGRHLILRAVDGCGYVRTPSGIEAVIALEVQKVLSDSRGW